VNVLIVYAHPEPRSFNGAMRDLAVQTLGELGHQVQVSDLYAMRFNPVAGPGDFRDRADPTHLSILREQRYAAAGPGYAPDIAAEHEKLFWADLIIFQFPLWWRSVPAIMKGYFDRVFTLGLIYGRGSKGLRGKKAMLAYTTGGPVSEDGEQEEIEWLNRQLIPIREGIIQYLGLEELPPYIAFGPAGVDDAKREQYLEAYRNHLIQLTAKQEATR
jgi:NAD(P)H dehydrogenase (quinone)